MIIDSHEHLMLPIEMQIEKLNQAGVDKAILFSTVSHPERAKNLAELRGEMNILYKVLAGANNKEANQDSGQLIKGNVSVQKTENGGHAVTRVLKSGTTTKFYDRDNRPVKVVTERLNSQDCVVRTTKTNHLIVTDILKNDGYSVSSSVAQTSEGYYKIVHENGFSEYLDQTGASIDAQEYASSLQNHMGVSFLKEEKPFKEE